MENTNFHVSICGHAKHGKSTLAGRLAYELKAITDRELEAYNSEAMTRGKDFNKYSMIFLKHRSDTFFKKTGLPDDSSRTEFPSRSSIAFDDTRLTLIDTPGFSRFLDNIIYGIYLSDQAIVVVEVNASVENGTEAVCRILKAFEIPILAFCVTKMDAVGYSQALYNKVEKEIREGLIAKYDLDNRIPIIPVSALEGAGVASADLTAERIPWYSGKSIMQALDDTQRWSNDEAKESIRFTIEGPREVYSPSGVGTILVGRLEYGTLKTGQVLVVEPVSSQMQEPIITKVRTIHLAKGVTDSSSEPIDEIQAKAIIALSASSWSKKDASKYLKNGGVLGTSDSRPSVAKRIVADLVFFEPDLVYSGKEYILHPHVSTSVVRFVKIIDKELISYNLVQEEYSVSSGEYVRAEIELRTPSCIEPHNQYPRLAKFIIRQMNKVVACGKCVEIIE